MNSVSYNSDWNGEMRWDEDGDGAGDEDDVDDDLNDARGDVMTMETISPSGRSSPRRNMHAKKLFSSL